MKRILFFIILSVIVFSVNAQLNSKKTINLSQNSVIDKFNEIYSKSGSYQEYKVIKKYQFIQLKKQVLDSFAKEKANYKKAQNNIKKLQNQITKLQSDLKRTNEQIGKLEAQKNSIRFLGIPVEKSQYQWMVWSFIGLLILALIYFIYLYTNSQKITKLAKNNLAKIEEEYYNFKSNALEREQNLKRQLLDEQNKNQG